MKSNAYLEVLDVFFTQVLLVGDDHRTTDIVQVRLHVAVLILGDRERCRQLDVLRTLGQDDLKQKRYIRREINPKDKP